MKKNLLLTLFISMAVIPLYAQTYHQGDSTALRAIDASCDASNKLNWNTESDPGKWDGVTWDNSAAPKRVSQINIESMQLTGTLNATALTNLTQLYCSFNKITSLDVSDLKNLTIIYCHYGKLTSLNISDLAGLTVLSCSNNQLTNLNASGLTSMTGLYCENNQLTSLDVLGLTSLTTLTCGNNQLTSLNVSSLTNLTTLYCGNNQLTNLDVSGLSKLENLDCYTNQLTSLNVTELKNLKRLYCYTNHLTSLNVSGLTSLQYFFCDTNQLSSLNVTGLTGLTNFKCTYNKLPFTSLVTGLDITNYTYNPQNTLFTPITLAGTFLIDYSAEALINGTATSFGFYKDDVGIEANNSGLFTTTGKGQYHCEMTNAKLPGLTLTTATITIIIDLATLTVTPSVLNINTPASSTATFNIISNTTWNITSSAGWLMLSSASGLLNKTITITAEANPSATSRTATVTVTGNGLTPQTITVTQAGPILSVSTSTLNVGFATNSIAMFDVTSNIAWNVASSKSWLTASPTSGSNNGSIVLTAEANQSDTMRTATVTISGTGVTSQTITVIQAATPALTVSASTLDIKAAANSTTIFTITSNTVWNITSSQPWLTVDPTAGSNNGTITLTAASNPSTTTRIATITISGAGVTPQTITITQAVKGATAITEITENDNNVYPNPVKDKLNIILTSGALPSIIGIYSMGGKALLLLKTTTSITEMNMENYQPGIYILKIMTPTQTIEKKILKQ